MPYALVLLIIGILCTPSVAEASDAKFFDNLTVRYGYRLVGGNWLSGEAIALSTDFGARNQWTVGISKFEEEVIQYKEFIVFNEEKYGIWVSRNWRPFEAPFLNRFEFQTGLNVFTREDFSVGSEKCRSFVVRGYNIADCNSGGGNLQVTAMLGITFDVIRPRPFWFCKEASVEIGDAHLSNAGLLSDKNKGDDIPHVGAACHF